MTDALPSVRAVLFDAGYTLIGVEPSVGDIYAKIAARHGVTADPARLNATFAAIWVERRSHEDHGELPTDEAEERAWWRDVVAEVFARVQPDAEFTNGFDAYFDELYALFATDAAWQMYPDVMEAFDALDGLGVRTAIVSNADSRFHTLLQALGIQARVEFTLISAEVGVRKPHPNIFQLALERLGLAANEVLFIGDSYEEDYVGATGVGMQALLLDRGNRHNGTCPKITNLNDLLAHLRETN